MKSFKKSLLFLITLLVVSLFPAGALAALQFDQQREAPPEVFDKAQTESFLEDELAAQVALMIKREIRYKAPLVESMEDIKPMIDSTVQEVADTTEEQGVYSQMSPEFFQRVKEKAFEILKNSDLDL